MGQITGGQSIQNTCQETPKPLGQQLEKVDWHWTKLACEWVLDRLYRSILIGFRPTGCREL